MEEHHAMKKAPSQTRPRPSPQQPTAAKKARFADNIMVRLRVQGHEPSASSRDPARDIQVADRERLLLSSNSDHFVASFRGCFNKRREVDDPALPAQLLMEPTEMEGMLKEVLEESPSRRAFIIGRSPESLVTAGRSFCLFSAYVRHINKTVTMTTQDILTYVKEQINQEKLRYLIADFGDWYNAVPKVRLSHTKLLYCNMDEARADAKETSTLDTMVAGVMLVLTLFECLPISTTRRPDPSRQEVKRERHQRNRAKNVELLQLAPIDKLPCGLHDLLTRFDQCSSAFKTPADVQSFLLGVTLASLGLRARSVSSGKKYLEKHTTGEDVKTENEHDDAFNNEGVHLYFAGLTGRHVRVWRLKSKPGDRGPRLKLEITIAHDKIKGYAAHLPTRLGLNWPSESVASMTEDWQMNGALAVVFLCCAAGTVCQEDLFSSAKEPAEEGQRVLISANDSLMSDRPLFCAHQHGKLGLLHRERQLKAVGAAVERLFDHLQLPACFYTTKSLRCGFALDRVIGFLCTLPDEQAVDKEQIRNACFTTTDWSRDEVDIYLRHILNSLQDHAGASNKGRVADWLETCHMLSIHARLQDYKFVSFEEFRDDPSCAIERSETKMMRCGWRLNNARHWSATTIRTQSAAQIRHRLDLTASTNRVVDLRRTLALFQKVMGTSAHAMTMNVAFYEALGKYYTAVSHPTTTITNAKAYMCPVHHCDFKCSIAEEANAHWKKEHYAKRLSLLYMCPCNVPYSSSKPGKWHALRQHVRLKHSEAAVDQVLQNCQQSIANTSTTFFKVIYFDE